MVQKFPKRGGSALWVIITVILVALVLVGVVVAIQSPTEETSELPINTEPIQDESDLTEPVLESDEDDDASMEPIDLEGVEVGEEGTDSAAEEAPVSDGLTFSGEVLAGSTSPVLDFVHSDYKKAVDSDRLVVLYFYANWCPICRAEFPKMKDAFEQLDGYDVVGFRVNYNDNQTDGDEKDLAQEFGVAYQHTKVFIKDGQRVLKSPESWSTDRYIGEIAEYR